MNELMNHLEILVSQEYQQWWIQYHLIFFECSHCHDQQHRKKACLQKMPEIFDTGITPHTSVQRSRKKEQDACQRPERADRIPVIRHERREV